MEDIDRLLIKSKLAASLDLARSFTGVPAGPFAGLLDALADATPSQVLFRASPHGDSFGIGAMGSGGALAGAALEQASKLLSPAFVAPAARLNAELGGPPVRIDVTLGRAGGVRLFFGVSDVKRARAAVIAAGMSEDDAEWLLRQSSAAGAALEGLGFVYVDKATKGLAVMSTVETQDTADAELVGLRRVQRIEVSGSGHTWYRTPAVKDRALIEWQHREGMGHDEARRVGSLNAVFEVDGPDWLEWTRSRRAASAIYEYTTPFAI